MVLRDVGDDGLGQLGAVRRIDTVGDMLLEDLRADLGLELIVDVLAPGLVLDERKRVGELADVVVVRGDTCEERIGRASCRERVWTVV